MMSDVRRSFLLIKVMGSEDAPLNLSEVRIDILFHAEREPPALEFLSES